MNIATIILALKIAGLLGAAFVLHCLATLFFYIALMAFMAASDGGRLVDKRPLIVFGRAVLFGGFLLDASLNLIWGTIVFLRWPQDVLLTGRLVRYKREGAGWRSRFAQWVCSNLLDPLAPSGCHCKS